MNKVSGYFRERLNKVAAATTETLEFQNPSPKIRHWFENLSVKNETTACTKAEVYITGHGYDHPLYEQASPVAGTLYWLTQEFWLHHGETLAIKFTGCTVGDKLAAYFSGHYEVLDREE